MINSNGYQFHLKSSLNSLFTKRLRHMTLDIHVLETGTKMWQSKTGRWDPNPTEHTLGVF